MRECVIERERDRKKYASIPILIEREIRRDGERDRERERNEKKYVAITINIEGDRVRNT